MQSRRDQVQAYFFVVGRLVSALMHGKPEERISPARRVSSGMVMGTLIGLVIVAGFGVAGLLWPGGDSSWRVPGTVIVEKETGARYLYLDGQLRPVLNYSSALLVVNSPNATTRSVSRKSLGDVPKAVPVGIPNAPDSLPSDKDVNQDPWVVCADALSTPTGARPLTAVQLRAVPGPLLQDDQGLLVSTESGADAGNHLVWRGKRLRIPDKAALAALGYGSKPSLPVTPAWLGALPAGPDLVAPAVAEVGETISLGGNRKGRVGEVFEVRNPVLNSTELYVLRKDGLSPVSRTIASLLIAAQHYPGAPSVPTPVGTELLTAAPRSTVSTLPAGLPDTPPRPQTVGSNTRPCVQFTGNTPVVVLANRSLPDKEPPHADSGADVVMVPSGRGALIRTAATPAAPGGAIYLVTDLGVKFPLPKPEVAGILGLPGEPVVVSPALPALLPTGPVLDPAAALTIRPVAPPN